MTGRGPYKKYSGEEGVMKQALELLKSGQSFREVSKHTGISLGVLHRHLGDVTRPRRNERKKLEAKKGLTKIRIEDCLRCDECSCIYLDPMDYDKHMRNKHQKFFTVRPRSPSPQEEETIKTMRYEKPKKPKALDTSFIVESNMVHSMKSRWSKVVTEGLSSAKHPRLEPEESLNTPVLDPHIVIKSEPEGESIFDPNVHIKEEPADDDNILDLLSQVEVKIKTEPPDDYGSF